MSNGEAGPAPSIDDLIADAQCGAVSVTPARAIAMAGQLYSRGRFAEAGRVCRQIIAARPANADAYNILGVSLAAHGKLDEGTTALRQAIGLNPNAPSYYANLGDVLRRSGRIEEAAQALEKAVELRPDHAAALNNLGIIQYERGRFAEAADYYRQVLAIDSGLAEVLNNLGNALRRTGDLKGAEQAYREALGRRAFYPEAHNNLGTLLRQNGKAEQAEKALRKAIEQKPGYVEAHNNLAQLLFSQRREAEALQVLAEAMTLSPLNVPTLLLTARIQLNRHNMDAAEQAVRLALEEEPEHAEAMTLLGQLLHETDRYDEAIAVLERAVRTDPGNSDAHNFYGVALKSVGRFNQAREHILTALELNDALYGGYANLIDLVDFSEASGEQLFHRMEAILEAAPDAEGEELVALHFAYAKALEDRGRHERALDHYVIGGRIKRKQLDYSESETFAFFNSIREAFPRGTFENRRYPGLSDDRPVFIIGMPRSGSTLVEQILSSHPGVHGAGEVKHFPRAIGGLRDRFPSLAKYPEMVGQMTPSQFDALATNYQLALAHGAGNAKKITDKLLTNYFFLGLINLLFPNAKIIHTRRDPVDTCLSGFTKLFKDDMPHSYDLAELGRYYGKYRELMEHWEKVLPKHCMTCVNYEEVVADTEKEARRLIDFLGLPWDDKCVDFHKSDRPVKTASLAQVRRPIYKTSVERWKKYGPGLQPLVDAIEGKAPKRSPKAKTRVKENA